MYNRQSTNHKGGIKNFTGFYYLIISLKEELPYFKEWPEFIAIMTGGL